MSRYPLTLNPVDSTETIYPHLNDRHAAVIQKIEEISGVNVFRCMQCGCCAAGCPVAEAMDYTPTQMMKLLQLGDFPALSSSNTVWTCASCFACRARCPKGIDLAQVAEAVREIFLRKGLGRQNAAALPRETLRQIPQVALISSLRKLSS
ncbi:MAG: heterodisulfide reductase [Candidatus Eisenbacteria bacterium]|nr:heterodisulfide reductase [Candidatus Eisenbacteria bacterium]